MDTSPVLDISITNIFSQSIALLFIFLIMFLDDMRILAFTFSYVIHFFFLVLPVYCYQLTSLHPRAHMLSHVIPWTSARQTPLSMDFSRQEYWSGLPFPSPAPFLIKLCRQCEVRF